MINYVFSPEYVITHLLPLNPVRLHPGKFISEDRVGTDAGAMSLLVVRRKHPCSNLQVAHIRCRDAGLKEGLGLKESNQNH